MSFFEKMEKNRFWGQVRFEGKGHLAMKINTTFFYGKSKVMNIFSSNNFFKENNIFRKKILGT